MSFLNIEIKAVCRNPAFIRNYLIDQKADFKGIDRQTDTYFNVKKGRLKLREGGIENNLIYYERENVPGPKSSHFKLVKVPDADGLREALTNSIGVLVTVRKNREIYYIGNVKFHIDDVPGLGSFVEIEAGNILADKSAEELRTQCDGYLAAFNIRDEDLVDRSYSDMLLERAEKD